MQGGRANRVLAVVVGVGMLAGGLYLARLSQRAAPRGALLIVAGLILILVAVWPKGGRRL